MLPKTLQTMLYKKHLVQCCLNTSGTTLHRKSPLKCCPRDSRQYYKMKNLVQCCLNTFGTRFHRENPMQRCPRGSRQHCAGKNPSQYYQNNIWSLRLHSCDYLKKISIKINVVTDEGSSQNAI